MTILVRVNYHLLSKKPFKLAAVILDPDRESSINQSKFLCLLVFNLRNRETFNAWGWVYAPATKVTGY